MYCTIRMPAIRTKRPVVIFLAISLSLVILAALQTSKVDDAGSDWWELKLVNMQERLEKTERQSHARAVEVHHLQKQIDDMKHQTNISRNSRQLTGSMSRNADRHMYFGEKNLNGSLSLPSALHYLPHLKNKPDGLKPALHITQGIKGVSVVLGIPTIKRTVETYLMETLNSVLKGMTQEEKTQTLIVVFIAETDYDYVKLEADRIQENFAVEVQSGLVEIMSPPAQYYPDLDHIPETFGDTKERVKWRTKQNLDFAFLMMYCRTKGTYYVQLEDDVIAVPGYITTMQAFAMQQGQKKWLLLEFSSLGFIGKLFKCDDLNLVAEFFLMFHQAKPIDWLLDHILYVLVCNPEKDAKHCQREKGLYRIRYKPSLFQHIGLHSSLVGKIQKLKDKDFKKGIVVPKHDNPAAEVSTTIEQYQKFSIVKAYNGQDIFWGTTPSQGSLIRFKFTTPILLHEYRLISGSPENPGDKLYNTTVEVLPSYQYSKREGVLETGEKVPLYSRSSDGYLLIGLFKDDGSAVGHMDKSIGLIQELRLRLQSELTNWVVLSEIYLTVHNKR